MFGKSADRKSGHIIAKRSSRNTPIDAHSFICNEEAVVELTSTWLNQAAAWGRHWSNADAEDSMAAERRSGRLDSSGP